ncbi:hypothetical protein ONZ45_g10417 [Pleurotus djamor]|nr:hypothetical protein ONZ45_g10417 [Pleurotus djamor]
MHDVMETTDLKQSILLLALGGLAFLLAAHLFTNRRRLHKAPRPTPASKSESSPDLSELSEVQKRIASDVSRFLYDYPIHLLCLKDYRLYDRTHLIRHLAVSIAGELESERRSNPSIDCDQKHTYEIFSKLSRYAIFSHRWGLDELDFNADFSKEIHSGKGDGATKLRNFCEKARQYGCQYVWFDTGCIHSANGAELDASIPFMYAWYSKAHVCIVHLAQTGSALGEGNDVDEWFQRGWTLQELLAPERLKFYNKYWDPLTDDEYDISRGAATPPESSSIVQSISRITGVDERSLLRFRKVKAFERLQIELLKRYDDRSLLIFDGETSPRTRMLPSSPAAFSVPFQGQLLPSDTILFREGVTSPDISLSIYGLHLSTVLYPVTYQSKFSCSQAVASIFNEDIGHLPCELQEKVDGNLFLGILGHAQLRQKRIFFEPPSFQFAAVTMPMNKKKDEFVMLKDPEMVYME